MNFLNTEGQTSPTICTGDLCNPILISDPTCWRQFNIKGSGLTDVYCWHVIAIDNNIGFKTLHRLKLNHLPLGENLFCGFSALPISMQPSCKFAPVQCLLKTLSFGQITSCREMVDVAYIAAAKRWNKGWKCSQNTYKSQGRSVSGCYFYKSCG